MSLENVGREDSSLRDLVSNCLAGDDFTPLLRLIFPSKTPDPGTGNSSRNSFPSSQLPNSKDEGQHAVQGIQLCLQAIAAEQEQIIDNVCHDHALEIAQCVSEMEAVQRLVSDLCPTLTQGHDTLQAAGRDFAFVSTELTSLTAAQKNLHLATSGLRGTAQVLKTCMEVGVLIKEHRLYAALQLLGKIREQHLGSMMSGLAITNTGAAALDPAVNSSHASPSNTEAAVAQDLSGSSSRLQHYCQHLVEELGMAVEYLAVAEFNYWLVSVRTKAQRIGISAIRRAAVQRQLDEELAAERKAVAAMLTAGESSIASTAEQLARTPFRVELHQHYRSHQSGKAAATANTAASQFSAQADASTRAQTAGNGRVRPPKTQPGASSNAAASSLRADVGALHLGEPQLAVQALLDRWRAGRGPAGGQASQPGLCLSMLEGVDMRGLFRCVHIQRSLGQMPAFRSYYLEQRRLQLTTDLTPPARFLDSYQVYLSQVAGFFLVERAVQLLLPGLVDSTQVALLWEAAGEVLKSTLDRELRSIKDSPILLLLKDWVLLLCSALEGAGCSGDPMREVLLNSRGSYHELLSSSTATAIGLVLRGDGLEEYVVSGEEELRELIEDLGLPANTAWGSGEGDGEGGAGLTLPLTLPFTRSVPALLRMLRGFVTDSLAFLKGLASPWELLQAVFQHRDRMISRVLAEALSVKLGSVNAPASLGECMRMAVNLWSLVAALDALDEWTIVRVRPTSAASGGDGRGGSADEGPGGTLRLPDAVVKPQGIAGGLAEAKLSATAARVATARARVGSVEVQVQGQRRYRALRAVVSSSTEGPSNGAQSALVALQDTAERCVLRLASSRVEAILEAARKGMWIPPGPMPDGVSAYVEECLAYVREIVTSGQAILPRPSFLFLARTLSKTIGLSFMRLFSPEKGIRAYNLYAIARLSSDLAAIQAWAEEVGVPNLSQEIAEPVQLCALLLSNKIEEMLVPDLRAQKYPNLEPSTVLLVLDRYKELAKVGKEKTNFPTRRAIDIMAKTLRTQIVIIGTGQRVLEDF